MTDENPENPRPTFGMVISRIQATSVLASASFEMYSVTSYANFRVNSVNIPALERSLEYELKSKIYETGKLPKIKSKRLQRRRKELSRKLAKFFYLRTEIKQKLSTPFPCRADEN